MWRSSSSNLHVTCKVTPVCFIQPLRRDLLQHLHCERESFQVRRYFTECGIFEYILQNMRVPNYSANTHEYMLLVSNVGFQPQVPLFGIQEEPGKKQS